MAKKLVKELKKHKVTLGVMQLCNKKRIQVEIQKFIQNPAKHHDVDIC